MGPSNVENFAVLTDRLDEDHTNEYDIAGQYGTAK